MRCRSSGTGTLAVPWWSFQISPQVSPSRVTRRCRSSTPALARRGGYTDFIKRIKQLHLKEYISRDWLELLGSTLLPSPIYIVGSWNEEFEGHAILPYDFNFSVPEDVQHGFDLVMAVKEAFGWNHYEARDIVGTPPPPISFDLPGL